MIYLLIESNTQARAEYLTKSPPSTIHLIPLYKQQKRIKRRFFLKNLLKDN